MKNKKFLIFAFAAFIFTSFTISVNALTSQKNSLIKTETERYYERSLLQVLVANKIEDNIKSYYNDSYPSYYGGMYISDDGTNVVLQIVKNNLPEENSNEYSFYEEIINITDSVRIEYVNNSYNQLNLVNDEISNIFTSKSIRSNYNNLSANYIDILNNKVVVELSDNNEVERETFKQLLTLTSDSKNYTTLVNSTQDNIVLDSSLISFSTGEYNTFATTIKAGGQIAVQDGYCSMGFRTKVDGNSGYVTAGHCVQKGLNSTIASGTVKKYQFSNNANYDYAFIQTNSSYSPSNTLAYNNGLSTALAASTTKPNVVVNAPIAKVGYSSGFTTGLVTGLNASVYYENEDKTIKGLVKSNLKSLSGDSGGVVLLPYSDSNGGGIAIGVLSGGNSSTPVMYFTNINNMPSSFLSGRY